MKIDAFESEIGQICHASKAQMIAWMMWSRL